MSNPVTPFRNNLFASRGMDIQSALDYSEMMINTLSATDQVAVRTAFGVVINTIESAVTQSQGPSPEKLAIIALIDERIDAHKLIREDAIGDVVDAHIDNLDDKISDWMVFFIFRSPSGLVEWFLSVSSVEHRPRPSLWRIG